jgi:localization factor PodJL
LAASDLTPNALPKAPPPPGAALAGSDTTPTGSLVSIPSFAAMKPARSAAESTVVLKQWADSGNAAAEYEMASRYAEGRLVTKDFALAANLFEKAARQGLVPAQYKLASLYEKGIGVPRDSAKARAWYVKAAEAGNPRAMHNLAVMIADGDGKPDYAGAVEWFRKAAEYGVHDSQYNLAILYARGLGVKQSLIQSYQWFAIAAEQSDVDAAKKRDEVAAKLSPDDLAIAKALAAAFHPKTADVAATEVEAPAGGWDSITPPTPLKSERPKLSSL